MCFLDFVEEQCSRRRLRYGQAEQTDFAEFAAKQQAEAVMRLILRHIEAKEFVLAHEVASKGDGEFRFPDTGRTEEKETAARTSRRRQAQLTAMQHRSHAWKDVILSADMFGQVSFEVAEMFEAVG